MYLRMLLNHKGLSFYSRGQGDLQLPIRIKITAQVEYHCKRIFPRKAMLVSGEIDVNWMVHSGGAVIICIKTFTPNDECK